MPAFWKREVRSYFQSLVGYVLIAAMLCMIGTHTYMICIVRRMPVFEQVLGSSALIFLLMVPILTMRTFSEERKSGILEFFYSLPISLGNLVLGKYLALLSILLLPLLFSMLYPLILGNFGTLNMGIIASSFLGFFAMGAALLAIGLFFSALLENQVAAAAVTFILLLLGYFMPSLSKAIPADAFVAFLALALLILLAALVWFLLTRNSISALSFALACSVPLCLVYRFAPAYLEGSLNKLMQSLSVYARLYSFSEGILDMTTLVYDGSLTVLMLFLTVQVLEYRRCR